MTQTAPTLPAAPKGTPAWLIRLVALAVALSGPALSWWDPGGKLNSGAVQAAIIVAFLFVGSVIFTIHVGLGAVHEYGWSKKAAIDVESQELAELRTLYPEFKQSYTDAKPALDQLPGFAQISERVGELEHAAQEKAQQIDMPTLAAQVKTLLAADAAGIPDGAVAAASGATGAGAPPSS